MGVAIVLISIAGIVLSGTQIPKKLYAKISRWRYGWRAQSEIPFQMLSTQGEELEDKYEHEHDELEVPNDHTPEPSHEHLSIRSSLINFGGWDHQWKFNGAF